MHKCIHTDTRCSTLNTHAYNHTRTERDKITKKKMPLMLRTLILTLFIHSFLEFLISASVPSCSEILSAYFV
jgi:hypothetical protein